MSHPECPEDGADSGPAAPEDTLGKFAQNWYAHMTLSPADLDIGCPGGNVAGALNLYAHMALQAADLDTCSPGKGAGVRGNPLDYA